MSGLTSEERSWHHKCTCGIAAGLSLVVEHDTDCPFGQRLDAIIAARLADAEARAEPGLAVQLVDDFYEGEGLPLATAESDALWGVIGRYRIGLGESILRIVGRIVRHRVAEAQAKALEDAVDGLRKASKPFETGLGIDFACAWLRDRAAALRPVDAPEGGAQ